MILREPPSLRENCDFAKRLQLDSTATASVPAAPAAPAAPAIEAVIVSLAAVARGHRMKRSDDRLFPVIAFHQSTERFTNESLG